MAMRFTLSLAIAAIFLFMGISCEREENKDIRLNDGSSDSYRLGPDETSVGEGAGITFAATGPWTATLTVGEQTIGDSEVPGNGDEAPAGDGEEDPGPGFVDEDGDGVPDDGQPMSKQAAMAKNLSLDWISIDPESGSAAGTYTMQVSLEPNNTGYDRSARIDIYCGDSRKTIEVVQLATEEGGDVSSPSDRPVDEREKRYVSRLDYVYSGPEGNLEGTYAYTYDGRRFVSHVSGPGADIYYEVDEGGHYTNLEVRGNAEYDMNGKPWWLTLHYFNVETGYGRETAALRYGEDAISDAFFGMEQNNRGVLERFDVEPYWHEGSDEGLLRENTVWICQGEYGQVEDPETGMRYETYNIYDHSCNGSLYVDGYDGMHTHISFQYSDVFLFNKEYEGKPLSNIDPNTLLLLCVDRALPASSFSSLFLAGYMPYWSTNLISSFSLNAGPDYGYGEPGEEDIVCNYQVDHTLDENGYVTGLRMTNDAGESWTFSIVYE